MVSTENRNFSRKALCILVPYGLFAVFWLFVSDYFLKALVSPENLDGVHALTDAAFVVLSMLSIALLWWFDQKHKQRFIHALEDSYQRYQELIDQASDAIFISDPDTNKYLLVNKAASHLTGYSEDELISMDFRSLLLKEELAQKPLKLHDVYAGKTVLIERSIRRKDGQVLSTELTVKQLSNGHVQALVRDISERKKLEQDLINNERRFRAMIENNREASILVDANGTLKYISPGIQHISGYTPEERLGRSGFETVHPDDAETLKELLDALNHSPNKVLSKTVRLKHKFKGYRWVIVEGQNLLADPAITAIIVHLRDVTAHVKHEERITQLNNELSTQVTRLSSLRRIDQGIINGLSLHGRLETVLNEVMQVLGVDAAHIMLYSSQARVLSSAAHRGFVAVKPDEVLQPGDGLAGQAVSTQQRVYVDGAKLDALQARALFVPQEGFMQCWAYPLVSHGEVQGVIELFNRSVKQYDETWHEFVSGLVDQCAIAIQHAQLTTALRRSNSELLQAYDETIEGWARALDLKDAETAGHSQRVTTLTLRLAQQLGVTQEELIHIRRGALLHDIGKMGVPDSILLKPGSLTATEWDIMKKHTTYARDFLANIQHLQPALDIPYYHHERWDGQGYPQGIAGTGIPLAARIFAVVDVYDALTSDRPYRKAWSYEKVIEHINNESGKHFDPNVATAFINLLQHDSSVAFEGGAVGVTGLRE